MSGLAVRRRRWIVDVSLTATLAVSILAEPRSIALHSLVGIAFTLLAIAHLWHRRRWIRLTLRRSVHRRSPSRSNRLTLAQNTMLLLLGIVMSASGLWDWTQGPSRIRVHAISSVAFTAIVARHAWTRRSGLRRPERRRLNEQTPSVAITAPTEAGELRPHDEPGPHDEVA